jgi:hypothetical protein
LADATEHSGKTVWPSVDASDDSTVHRRDWTPNVISDREEEVCLNLPKTFAAILWKLIKTIYRKLSEADSFVC